MLFASVQVGEDASGLILNISEGGMCVQSAKEMASNGPVQLRFQCLQSHGWVEAQGRIAWRNEAKTIAGIEFVSMGAEARQEVRTWLSFGNSLQELRGNWATDRTVVQTRVETDFVPFISAIGDQERDATLSSDASQMDKETPVLSARGPNSAARLQTAPIAVLAIALLLIISLAILAGQRAHWVGHVASLLSKKTVAPSQDLRSPSPPSPATEISASPAPPRPLAFPAGERATSPRAPSPSPAAEASAKFVLQVAAMSEKDNATQLAQSLRLNSFPAFVFQRHSDHFYRVVVGPYPDSQSVHSARNALEKEGMKPIAEPWTPEDHESNSQTTPQ